MTNPFRSRMMTQLFPSALLDDELYVELPIWRVTLQSDYLTLKATPVMTLKVEMFDVSSDELAIRDGKVAHYGKLDYRYYQPFVEFYRYEACTCRGISR